MEIDCSDCGGSGFKMFDKAGIFRDCTPCELSDFHPCGENFSDCSPGIKKIWEELTEEQQSMCESDCDFYIVKKGW